MEFDKRDKKPNSKDPQINHKNGLNIAYDMKELKSSYPNLMEEIGDKRQFIKINAVEQQIEQNPNESEFDLKNDVPSELTDPGVTDFIRRCTNNEEAMEILDYLLKRKEISSEEYDSFKKEIMMDGGLKNLIERCGGPKNPGYYIDKYYNKTNQNQKFKSNKD